MQKVSAWCRSHPWFTSLAGVGVFFCGIHLLLNWRAEQRWQRYCAEARARGVKLTLLEFAPPEIPESENFAALPMLRAAFAGNGTRPLALATSGQLPSLGNAVKGEPIDWAAWQTYFQKTGFITEVSADPVRDTLRGLDHYAPQLQEWSQWRTHPRSRFALDLKAGAEMPLPHLSTFMDAAKVFSLKTRAHLALGESATGYAAFREGLQAYQALTEEPTLLSGLVRLAVLTTLVPAVGDGLAHHSWTEPELRQIDADLATVRIWQDFRMAMSSERGFVNSVSDTLADSSPIQRGQLAAKHMAGAALLGTSSTQFSPAVCALIPKRVYRDNQLRENHYFDELLARVDAEGAHFDPDREMLSTPDHLTGVFEQYYYFLAGISVPVFGMMEKRYLTLQILLDEMRLAIALERYRLRHNAYPADLADLVPEFCAELPRDVFSGQPYCYRRTDAGSFLLYSVGQNRRDDHGQVDRAKSEKEQLDAIWLYAPPP